MGLGPQQLWELLEPYLSAEGVELDDIELLGRGDGRILRVTVDGDGGLLVDRIAALSRGMGALLEAKEAFDGSYTLEVSSPGLERKLRRPSHYLKSLGREVKVKTSTAVEGAVNHKGVLEDGDDEGFTVRVDNHLRRIAYEQVDSARTIFVWEKSPKPGKRQ